MSTNMHECDDPTFAVSFEMPSQSTGPSFIGRPRDALDSQRKAVGQFLRHNPFSAQSGTTENKKFRNSWRLRPISAAEMGGIAQRA